MGLRAMIARQFRRPAGLLGFWAERTMAKRNSPFYDRVIELLEIRDTDRVLEIGFGAGVALRRILTKQAGCTAMGIDFSEIMRRKAIHNNRVFLQQGRLELLAGDICTHDFGERTFTKIFAINVIYFWDDLTCIFTKLQHLLAPGGRMVLFMSSAERLNQVPFAVDSVFNKYPIETVLQTLHTAGFARVEKHEIMNQGTATYCVCADKD